MALPSVRWHTNRCMTPSDEWGSGPTVSITVYISTGTAPGNCSINQLLEGPAELLRDQTENPGTVMLPAAQFTLDANFGIPSKIEIDLGAGGETRVFWPPVAANTPPRDTDDAGK